MVPNRKSQTHVLKFLARTLPSLNTRNDLSTICIDGSDLLIAERLFWSVIDRLLVVLSSQ